MSTTGVVAKGVMAVMGKKTPLYLIAIDSNAESNITLRRKANIEGMDVKVSIITVAQPESSPCCFCGVADFWDENKAE